MCARQASPGLESKGSTRPWRWSVQLLAVVALLNGSGAADTLDNGSTARSSSVKGSSVKGSTATSAPFAQSPRLMPAIVATTPSAQATQGAPSLHGATTPVSQPSAAGAAASASASSEAAAVPSAAISEPSGFVLWKERTGRAWSFCVSLVFGKWSSPLFEANFWNTTLAGLRVLVPLALAALLLGRLIVRRGHGHVPAPLEVRLARTFTVLGFVLHYGAFNPNVRHPGFYQPRAFYHDYLGAKYHQELSDGWLVDCSLVAEKELGKEQAFAQRYVRSRENPSVLVLAPSVSSLREPNQCSSRFAPERWGAFVADIRWFVETLEPGVWAELHRSSPHLNGPLWSTLVTPFVRAPASEGYFRLLAWTEPVLHGLALAAVSYGFGPLATALTSVTWGCQPFFGFDGGATLFGSTWLPLWLVGLCAWQRKRSALGAVSLGVGIGLQPLLGLALVPLIAGLGARLVRGGALAPGRAALTLGSTLALVCLLGASTGELGNYVRDLERHAAEPELSDLGLPALLANHGAARYQHQRDTTLPDPTSNWVQVRSEQQRKGRVWQWAALAVATGGAAALAWRRRSMRWGARLGFLLPTLVSQTMTACAGLIPHALACHRQTEASIPLLLALVGSNVLVNQTTFADDQAALLTALLWMTTPILVLTLVPLRLRRLRAAGRPSEVLADRR